MGVTNHREEKLILVQFVALLNTLFQICVVVKWITTWVVWIQWND